jgi:hypothetical protein
MVPPTPGNRRDRRNAAIALAKEYMRGGQQKGHDWNQWLSVLGLAMAGVFFLVYKSEPVTIVCLVCIFGLLIWLSQHIMTRVKWKKLSEMKFRMSLAVAISLAITVGVGWQGWPAPTKREWSLSQRQTFELLIQNGKGKVKISALANDNEAYRFADELVLAFTEAGWDVEPKHPPTIVAAGAIENVTIVYTDQKELRADMIVSALKKVGIKATSQYWIPGVAMPLGSLSIEVGKME